jgi:hypothetical protein
MSPEEILHNLKALLDDLERKENPSFYWRQALGEVREAIYDFEASREYKETL